LVKVKSASPATAELTNNAMKEAVPNTALKIMVNVFHE
jgi:hypothetical protein